MAPIARERRPRSLDSLARTRAVPAELQEIEEDDEGQESEPQERERREEGHGGSSALGSGEDAPASQLREDEIGEGQRRIHRDIGRPPLRAGLLELLAPRGEAAF